MSCVNCILCCRNGVVSYRYFSARESDMSWDCTLKPQHFPVLAFAGYNHDAASATLWFSRSEKIVYKSSKNPKNSINNLQKFLFHVISAGANSYKSKMKHCISLFLEKPVEEALETGDTTKILILC